LIHPSAGEDSNQITYSESKRNKIYYFQVYLSDGWSEHWSIEKGDAVALETAERFPWYITNMNRDSDHRRGIHKRQWGKGNKMLQCDTTEIAVSLPYDMLFPIVPCRFGPLTLTCPLLLTNFHTPVYENCPNGCKWRDN
jgi:hypothetical protein